MEEKTMTKNEVLSLARETLELHEDRTYRVKIDGLEVDVKCTETDLKYITIDAIDVVLNEEIERNVSVVPRIPSAEKIEEMRLWFDIRANENVPIDMEALYKMVIKPLG